MIKITKVDDSDINYNWEDEVCLDDMGFSKDIVILGDRKSVVYGDDLLVDIIRGDYYDDDTREVPTEDGFLEDEVIGYDYDLYEELEKKTGNKFEEGSLQGYGQGDYCTVYYNSAKIDVDFLKELEIWIMGKVSEYKIEEDEDDEYYSYIPHDVEWKGKKAICEYFGFDEKDCVVYEEDGETEVTD